MCKIQSVIVLWNQTDRSSMGIAHLLQPVNVQSTGFQVTVSSHHHDANRSSWTSKHTHWVTSHIQPSYSSTILWYVNWIVGKVKINLQMSRRRSLSNCMLSYSCRMMRFTRSRRRSGTAWGLWYADDKKWEPMPHKNIDIFNQQRWRWNRHFLGFIFCLLIMLYMKGLYDCTKS